MKEYWVNVYSNGRIIDIGREWPDRDRAIMAVALKTYSYKLNSRIHVKMKPSIKEIIEDAQNSLKYLPNSS